jgi:uncharacterized coiled-coil protein SlyX
VLLFTMDQPSLSERLATIERRAFLSQRLEALEQHIAEGNAQIARQRRIIADLKYDGLESASTKAPLDTLLYSQSLYEADRIGILNELSQARADLQKETAPGSSS